MYADLKTKGFLIPTLSIAFIYILFVIYLMNVNLLRNTLSGDYPFSYKFNILTALLGGMWTAMTHFSLLVLVITAVLTGANLTLIVKRIRALHSSKGVHLILGSSILGVIGSGCVACGLPIISLFGLTGSLLFLPYRGAELSIIALVLLSASLYFLLSNNLKYQACQIKAR